MIALLDGMPMVQLPEGKSVLYDKTWIIAALRSAAERSGQRNWWLAEHIAESVTLYLRRDFESNSVGIPNLEAAVHEVLGTLGFPEIAEAFHLPEPPVHLSLTDLVREAGEGYELAFFDLLKGRLRRIAGSHAERLEIHDLTPCLRMLGGKRGRRNYREGLRGEIVGFIREFGIRAGGDRCGEPLEIRVR
jgi:hypothetical protein